MEHETETNPNATPAPYGRACTNCARAKCRCMYRPGGTDCERCHRLRKECVPSVSVRKRNGKRAHVSRAAQLEAKLEDLVTLLRHQAAPVDKGPPRSEPVGSAGVSTPSLSVAPSTTSHTDDNGSSPRVSAPPIVALPPQLPDCGPGKRGLPVQRGTLLGSVFEPPDMNVPMPTPTPPPSFDSAAIPICPYQPTPHEAAENLVTFRKYMLIFLPFVHLPQEMTQDRLRRTYPFLWFSIMTITAKNVDRRLVMSEAGRKFIAQKMVLENEKSLDLLYGLLVVMGWTHYHLKRDKPILSLLASLAKSLIFDMGLNKIPSEPYISACLKTAFHPPPREKTIEERRAVLACFLLTSQIAHSLKRLDALTWTPHMEESLQILSQRREWEGDDLLVAQVKIQLIVEQLNRAASQSPDNAPPAYYLSALQTQLQNVRVQLPDHLQQNDTILSLMSYTELAIHESALAQPRVSALGSTGPDLQRYTAMEACLTAIKDWFDRHFSIPSYVYIGMTFSYWCHMAHCLLSLYRLSILDDPAWDRRAVRQKVDLVAICDRLKVGFEELSARRKLESGPTIEEDGFSKFNAMLRSMKSGWSAEIAALDGNTGMHTGSMGMSSATSAVMHGNTADHNPYLDGTDGGLNMPMFQTGEDPEAWIAGLFDMNWDP
ncbi:hypothetical protein QBC35DRAFT_233924 [Podospora australis]|uniref:Zn(2)-C6 fungal-type domain-containing protein n=1 Tax=Podospora australis TaxID=1536484 RepID=A0AAN7AHH3_9PEZI|nr:hypothetical protein QBC35DRAFT_233924 [Podospora australis]